MRPQGVSCVALAILACFGACAQLRRAKAPATTQNIPPAALGTIATVNEARRFVLIDVESRMFMPQPGAELHVRNEKGNVATLKVTADRRWPFVVADIVSGEPASGDEVFP